MKVTNQKKSKLLFSASTENSILYINLSTLIDNWKQLLFKIKNSQLAVSIKANAYGLGLERIGKELKKNRLQIFLCCLC